MCVCSHGGGTYPDNEEGANLENPISGREPVTFLQRHTVRSVTSSAFSRGSAVKDDYTDVRTNSRTFVLTPTTAALGKLPLHENRPMLHEKISPRLAEGSPNITRVQVVAAPPIAK